MILLIKQVFIAFFSFSGSLATKCMFFNDESCIARPTLIDLNPIKRNYFPFMISLDKCNGSCNVVGDLSRKICVPSEAEDINKNKLSKTIDKIYFM